MALYHVWFATKGRKWLLQGDVGEAARELIMTVAREKSINLVECEMMVDHVHLLIAVDDGAHLSKAINLLKGATSRCLFQRFPELKLDAGVDNFWQHRYAAKAVAEPAAASVGQYIRTQWQRLDKYER
ncbi:MAG: IS200/IS605 family transposase [Dehalococcoidia bacterium]